MSDEVQSAVKNPSFDYRARIYDRYASIFKDSQRLFDPDAARRWGRAYKFYFRDWYPLNRKAAIADLACGDGRLLFHFKELGYENLHGVDISTEQVDLARQVAPTVVQGNVLDYLTANVGAFDLLTGIDIVEHLHKNEVLQFLDACLAALKAGGRLILQTPNAESPWIAAVRYGDFTHEVCFTPGSLSRLLTLCGFTKTTFREQGPPPFSYSVNAGLRRVAWRLLIVLFLRLYNRIETGETGSGVFTRVFVASALKPVVSDTGGANQI